MIDRKDSREALSEARTIHRLQSPSPNHVAGTLEKMKEGWKTCVDLKNIKTFSHVTDASIIWRSASLPRWRGEQSVALRLAPRWWAYLRSHFVIPALGGALALSAFLPCLRDGADAPGVVVHTGMYNNYYKQEVSGAEGGRAAITLPPPPFHLNWLGHHAHPCLSCLADTLCHPAACFVLHGPCLTRIPATRGLR